MIHDLDDEELLAEDIDELGAGLAGFLVFAFEKVLGDDGGEAAGESDKTLAVLDEGFEVGPRVAIEALSVRLGDDLAEVLVAFEVARE